VALLQESGVFNGDTYLFRKVDFSRQLKEFTLCTWLSLNYLRGEVNYWFSMGTSDNDQLLYGGKIMRHQK
jgi:hypothetical protein